MQCPSIGWNYTPRYRGRLRIIWVEDEDADHYNTATALWRLILLIFLLWITFLSFRYLFDFFVTNVADVTRSLLSSKITRKFKSPTFSSCRGEKQQPQQCRHQDKWIWIVVKLSAGFLAQRSKTQSESDSDPPKTEPMSNSMVLEKNNTGLKRCCSFQLDVLLNNLAKFWSFTW